MTTKTAKRIALEARADELKIDFPANIGDDTLQKKVDEAEEKAKADVGKVRSFLVRDRLRHGGKLLKPGQTVRMSSKDAAPLIDLGVLGEADDD